MGETLEVAPELRVTCFQSRLGRNRWIRPHTDVMLAEAARQGVKQVVILVEDPAAAGVSS